MKQTGILFWKSKAQGYCLGQNEVKSSRTRTGGKDLGLRKHTSPQRPWFVHE